MSELSEQFHETFRVYRAVTPEQRAEVFAIRYRVYCEEFGFEDAQRFPNRQEIDACDTHAEHCLIEHLASGRRTGCVRLVRTPTGDPHYRFPFEAACAGALDASATHCARERLGEISRLAVDHTFRRRQGESDTPTGQVITGESNPDERRRFPMIAPGLYLAAAALGLDAGLDCVFAMMEPRLARHLSRFGIRFEQVGPVVDFHGPRAPFRITREGLFAGLAEEIADLLTEIRRQLAAPAPATPSRPAAHASQR